VAVGSRVSADRPWLLRLDPLAGLLLAALVAQSTWRLARRSLLGLLDATVDEPLQQAINRGLARHVESYDALHGVRARYSGVCVRVEIFLGFSPDLPGRELLARGKAIKADLEAAIPRSEVWVVPCDEPPSAV
jgi:divalent metal cation (Fe/Co/Zn/Cd) transporter